MSSASLLEFPCTFPIKVMGLNTEAVRTAVRAVAENLHASSGAIEITERASRTGKYASFTLVMQYQSKVQLDAVYHALVQIDGVSMVL